MRLENKVAMVTGRARVSGFGAEIARVFAREGAKVAVLDINGEGAATGCARGRPRRGRLAADVTKRADIENAVRKTMDAFGRIDIVVKAGRMEPQRTGPCSKWARTSSTACTRSMSSLSITWRTLSCRCWRNRAAGRTIINIGSTSGIRPRPGLTWYNGSKGAVNLMSRSMAVRKIAPQKIRVNCVAPVMGATGLLEQFMGLPDTPQTLRKFIATVPLGRLSETARHRQRLPLPCPPTRRSS